MSTLISTADQPAAVGQAGNAASRYAVFKRRQQFFGLSIELVREVLPGQPLTRVPRSGEQILGVLSLRGEILPVVVMDSWLGLGAAPDDPNLPILVLRRAELLVGLRVDAIQRVVNIAAGEIQSHPAAGGNALLQGIWQPAGQTPITLIDNTALVELLCRSTSTNS